LAALRSEDFSNPEGIGSMLAGGFGSLRPVEKLTPVEWAEKHVRIAAGNAIPGLVRMHNAPFQAEPLNLVADPECREITLMWSAQTGKTLVQLMALGYFVEHDPCSQMMMQPSQGDLQTWLTAKFDPMVDESDAIGSKIAQPRSKQGVNNQRMKQYPGGFLMFAWAGSPKTLRGRSAPKIFADEIDGYERTVEGSQLALIWQRAATFGDQRLLFKTSTPTFKGASEIEASFLAGDRRRWFVKCPSCGFSQYLKWIQVQWHKSEGGEHDPDSAVYVCEADGCGSIWDELDRIKAIRGGEWVAERPFNGHASFHLPEMASLFVKLPDMARSFLEKKATGDSQTFINVSLAETWDEAGDKHDPDLLWLRREIYAAELPAGVVVLVAGVDVQDDRLEATLFGIGIDGRSTWIITHRVFRGDPGHSDLWDRLDEFLVDDFEHESGVRLRIAAVGVDSGGHYTSEVYKFCKARSGRRVYALKGSNQNAAPLVGRPTNRNSEKCDLFAVGTGAAKDQIFNSLKIDAPEKLGFIHFPMVDPMIDREFFAQITAEKRVKTYKNGFPVPVYKKVRPRNEALDCWVYAIAALEILRPNLKAIASKILAKVGSKKAKKTSKKTRKKRQTDSLSVQNVATARKVSISRGKKRGFIKRY
jgi:phage terminase large subunit GpA-like protein